MENIYKKASESAQYIKDRIKGTPEIAVILGSGLGVLAKELEGAVTIKYSDIPNFPVSTVEGHAGELAVGMLKGKYVLCMNGRFHFYEGYSMTESSFPVRVMALLGIKNLMVTNAAGGINKSFNPGDLMIIKDHIKFFDDSPLRGRNVEEMGPRFPDVSNAYDRNLRAMAKAAAANVGVSLQEGVYAFMPGPTYETPAEIRALGILGADAVGMSTVSEVIAAAHCGMRTLGISCISNMAAGILDQPLNHKEVMETAEKVKDKFLKAVKSCVENWN